MFSRRYPQQRMCRPATESVPDVADSGRRTPTTAVSDQAALLVHFGGFADVFGVDLRAVLVFQFVRNLL